MALDLEPSVGSTRELVPQDAALGDLLGGKTIGWLGSWILVVNNITGPGMMHISLVFQSAGIVAPLVLFVVVCCTSTATGTLFCDAIARLPHNEELKVRCEYSDAFRHYLGARAFLASQVLFFLAMFSQAALSIVETAQSMDGLLVLLFGRTWGLEVARLHFLAWAPAQYCGSLSKTTECVPFASLGDGQPSIGCILSAGYVGTLVLLAPLGRLNLDDSIAFQIVAFGVLAALSLEFSVGMLRGDFEPSRVPWFGSDYSSMLGTILFNYAFCPTIPSWLNEKRQEVGVGGVLWNAAASSTVLYLLLGLLGAMSFKDDEDNLLQNLAAGREWVFTKVCTFLFGVLVLGLGIPVFCILMRYNLIAGQVCGPAWATCLAVVSPWMLSWLLYQGKASGVFLNSTGTVLIALTGFIGPLLVVLAASGMRVRRGNCLRVLPQLWQRVDLEPTVCMALPRRWLHHQRRYASALLVVLVPMVLVGVYLQLAGP